MVRIEIIFRTTNPRAGPRTQRIMKDQNKKPDAVTPVASDALLALPDSVMRFRNKIKGAILFGEPVERLDRESLLAALGWALNRDEDTKKELKRRTDFLLSIKG
jgi:hypothetical protein